MGMDYWVGLLLAALIMAVFGYLLDSLVLRDDELKELQLAVPRPWATARPSCWLAAALQVGQRQGFRLPRRETLVWRGGLTPRRTANGPWHTGGYSQSIFRGRWPSSNPTSIPIPNRSGPTGARCWHSSRASARSRHVCGILPIRSLRSSASAASSPRASGSPIFSIAARPS